MAKKPDDFGSMDTQKVCPMIWPSYKASAKPAAKPKASDFPRLQLKKLSVPVEHIESLKTSVLQKKLRTCHFEHATGTFSQLMTWHVFCSISPMS